MRKIFISKFVYFFYSKVILKFHTMVTKNALDGFKNKDHEIGSILSTLFNLDFKVYNTALV